MHNLRAVGALLAGLTLIETSALGSVVDQYNIYVTSGMPSSGEYWPVGVGTGGSALGQTFVAGRSGTLDAVEIQIHRNAAAPDVPFTLSVYTTDNGMPTGDALASVASAFDDTISAAWFEPTVLRLTFATFAIPIAAGDEFAIIIEVAAGVTAAGFWTADLDEQNYFDPYLSGQGLYRYGDYAWMFTDDTGYRPVDFGFATYVTPVPLPAAGVLLPLALLSVPATRSRK